MCAVTTNLDSSGRRRRARVVGIARTAGGLSGCESWEGHVASAPRRLIGPRAERAHSTLPPASWLPLLVAEDIGTELSIMQLITCIKMGSCFLGGLCLSLIFDALDLCVCLDLLVTCCE